MREAMATNACAVRFLGQLEREEMKVLTWGLVDSFFSDDELEEKANRLLVFLLKLLAIDGCSRT